MKKESFIYFLIAGCVGIIVITSFIFGGFSGFEYFFEDLLISKKPIRSDIVIIAIDNESIQKIGQWPWPRKVFAEALLNLNKQNPRVVGIDVMFSEASSRGNADDSALSNALARVPYPVILPVEGESLRIDIKREEVGVEGFLKPLPVFLENKNSVFLGHVNLIADSDGIVRTFPRSISLLENPDTLFNSFAYALSKKSGIPIPNEETLANLSRIAYSAETGGIQRIPFWRLIETPDSLELNKKIILIGATAADLHDALQTPFSRGTEMPGVEIQANIATMILSGYRIMPLNFWPTVGWIFTAVMLSALMFVFFQRSLKPLFANIILGLLHTIAIIIFFEKGVAANMFHISGAWVLSTSSLFSYRYFMGERERSQMRKTFSKYVSKDVLDVILEHPEKVTLGGEEKEITVFFSDIRGFTTISEKTTPKELVRILNKYFTAMTKEVLNHKGVLDKYIGDAIMAFWGAPIEDLEQADHALQASIAMIHELKKLNEELRRLGDPEINIGIGLYTGPAIVGNIGSDLRFDYTVIGDTVNVASRLEGLNKEFKTNIIIGESTKNKLKGAYEFIPLGSTAVKGRKEPLNIYTVEVK